MFNSSNNSESTFNVEDLVKKIDAKIAELEEEERREKEKQEQNIINQDSVKLNDLIPSKEDEEEPKEVKQEPTVSDDAFFDDFFSDE